MGVTKFTQEIVVPVAPARIFKALIVDSHNLLPKLVPQSMESIELVGGDGGAGTIKITKFAQGGHFKFLKHRIDVLDTENLYCKNTLIEGDVLFDKIDSVVYESKFEASGDGGCVCKLTSEYHAKDGVELKEEDIKEGKDKAAGLFKVVEAYLVENLTAWTAKPIGVIHMRCAGLEPATNDVHKLRDEVENELRWSSSCGLSLSQFWSLSCRR